MIEDVINRDRELFRLIALDDEQAFARFFEAYAANMAGYVARFLRSELWAEEIVQDVFLKLWTMRDKLENIDVPAAFLHRMILNRAKDHIKHRGHEVRLQHYLTGHINAKITNDTQDLVDFRIGKKLFDEAVSKLPRQRAIIFKMRYEQALSYEDIARELNISANTVRNLLNLATQNIRTYLLERGGITGKMLSFILF